MNHILLLAIITFTTLVLSIIFGLLRIVLKPLFSSERAGSRFYIIVSRFINKFVLTAYNPVSVFLLTIFQTLKKRLQSKSYKYDLPLILVLKEQNVSMIGSAIKQIQIKTQAVRLPFDPFFATCLSDGVVLETEVESAQDNLNELCGLIANHRSLLPLDSIVVVLSVDNLLSSDDDLILLAYQWKDNVLKVNRSVNALCPLYIMFSGFESLEGAETFIKLINTDQILGYSNEYGSKTLPLAFSSIAFNKIQNQIVTLCNAHIITSDNNALKTDSLKINSPVSDLIIFMSKFANLKEKFIIFIDYFIRAITNEKEIIIRGVYFSASFSNQGERRELFVSDLFNKKIFVERGLCVVEKGLVTTRNYWLKLMQLCTLFVFIFFAYQLVNNRYQLINARHKLHPKLESIRMIVSKYEKDDVSKFEHIDDLDSLINNIQLTNYRKIFFPSIPTCYLSGLWNKKDDLLEKVCDKLIISQLFKFLNEKIRNLDHDYKFTSHDWLLEHAPAFKDLSKFVFDLSLIYQIHHQLQELEYEDNIHTFNDVINKFYNVSLDLISCPTPWIYTHPLHTKVYPIVWNSYIKMIHQLWDEKTAKFENLLSANHIKGKIDQLRTQLVALENNKPDLFKLNQAVNDMLNWLEYEATNMFGKEQLVIGTHWHKFKHEIEYIKPLISQTRIDAFYKTLDDRFQEAKSVLFKAFLPIIGHVIIQDTQGNLHASPEIFQLASLIKLLLSDQIIAEEKNTKKQFFNLDTQVLADISNKISIFKKLLAPSKLNDDGSAKKETIKKEGMKNLLAQVFLSRLSVHKSEFNDVVNNPLNNANAGYLVQILTFGRSIGIYDQLASLLNNTIFLKGKELKNKVFETYNFTNLSDLESVKDFCNTQAEELKEIFNDMDLETYSVLKQAKVIINHEFDELLNIWKQVKLFDKNKGQLYLLHQRIFQIIQTNSDSKDSKQTYNWPGQSGKENEFFKIKFDQAIRLLNKTKKQTEIDKFIQESEEISNIYENQLAHTFPFNKHGNDAQVEDVQQLCKQLDSLVIKFNQNWITHHSKDHAMIALVNKLLRMKTWLEAFSGIGNKKMNAIVRVIDGMENITQIILEIDNKKIDFKSGALEFALPIDKLKLTIQLADIPGSSKILFTNKEASKYQQVRLGQKTKEIEFQGPWAIWRMKSEYGNIFKLHTNAAPVVLAIDSQIGSNKFNPNL